jgi:hypothetical protein
MRFTRLRVLLLALSVVLILTATTYNSSGAEEPQQTQPTATAPAASPPPLRNNCTRLFTQKQFKRYAPKVYYRERITMKSRRHMRFMIRCQHSDKAQHKMAKLRRALSSDRKQRLRMARLARSLTPYGPCYGGMWAIPCSIIGCESGGSWTAHNPHSPARGPYQLLGHGEPWPVRTDADRLAHHRIASQLWNGGAGRGQWEC